MPVRLPRRAAIASLVILLFTAPALAQQPAPAKPAKPADLATQVSELQTRLTKVEAQSETNTLALAQISSRLSELAQQLETLRAAQSAGPEVVDRVDETTLRTNELERQVEELRTQLADLEQPYAAPSSSSSSSGLTLGSGDFTMMFSGYLHLRWQLLLPRQFDTITESTFRVRRARLGVKGNAGSIFDYKIRYSVLAELLTSPALRDYYADVEFRKELIVRVGQQKLPHLRNFMASSSTLLFPDRSAAVNSFRYDRDIGVWLHGKVLDGRVGYSTGVANGSGQNTTNDNIDFAISARVDGVALGERFPVGYGDAKNTAEPAVMVGASVVHDLVRVPETIAGVPVVERDVDSDAILDNVRVLSAAADATFRYQGIELVAEALLRRESWGTILEHSANEDLASLIGANSAGNKTYLGVLGQASYFVWPKTVVVGLRAGYSEPTRLRLGRSQATGVEPGDKLFEAAAVGQLYRNGRRLIGLQYSLTNYNTTGAPDPNNDIEHVFILESSLVF